MVFGRLGGSSNHLWCISDQLENLSSVQEYRHLTSCPVCTTSSRGGRFWQRPTTTTPSESSRSGAPSARQIRRIAMRFQHRHQQAKSLASRVPCHDEISDSVRSRQHQHRILHTYLSICDITTSLGTTNQAASKQNLLLQNVSAATSAGHLSPDWSKKARLNAELRGKAQNSPSSPSPSQHKSVPHTRTRHPSQTRPVHAQERSCPPSFPGTVSALRLVHHSSRMCRLRRRSCLDRQAGDC